jgi:predicted DNA-binding antitoxin AbrB/MazE fold protein
MKSLLHLFHRGGQKKIFKIESIPKYRINSKFKTKNYQKKDIILAEVLMKITVKSKIEKGWIRLPKKVRLPDGTRIIVQIEPILKTQEKHKILSELSGSWSGDSTIMPIFEELEQERHRDAGREVTFE